MSTGFLEVQFQHNVLMQQIYLKKFEKQDKEWQQIKVPLCDYGTQMQVKMFEWHIDEENMDFFFQCDWKLIPIKFFNGESTSSRILVRS